MPPHKIAPKKKADPVDPSIDSQDLRRQAEMKLSKHKNKAGPIPASEADLRRLVHELEVHQIELEMQNENLKQARDASEAALNQYTDLYDFAPVGYFKLARDGTILKVNLTGANLLDMERGSLIRRRFGLFVSDECRASFTDFLEQLFECREKENGEFVLKRDGHEPLWVQIEASCLGDGQECRALVVDTTERKKKEERIRFQANILEAVGQSVIGTDLSGTIIYWNRFAEELYGWQEDEAIGKSIVDVTPSQTTKEQAVEIMAHLGSGETWSGEFQVQRRDGTAFPAFVTNSPIRDEHGVLIGIIGVSNDISERKRAEKKLRQSQRQLRALTNYQQTSIEKERAHIAREIHDQFGQLLAGLKMDLSWLARHLDANSEHQERFRLMNDQIDEAIDLTRRIASDLRPGLLDDLGLFPALEWLMNEFDRRSAISCTLILPPEKPDLEPDLNTALFRIFQECLTNIFRHAQASKVEGRLTVSDDELQMEITDNGRGISKSELKHINSYGLLGMQERVSQWGGTLQITGDKGKGTTIMVKIPLPAFRQKDGP